MRVLLVGGTGFIGAALANSLIEDGDEVVCITRNPGKAIQKIPQVENIHHADVVSDVLPKSIFSNVDAVVNLAGKRIPGIWTKRTKNLILSTRQIATQNLVDAMRDSGVGVLVNGSALGYYGDRGDEILSESADAGSGFLADVCKSWENSAHKFEGRLVLLRSGHVLGLGGLMTPMKIIANVGLLGKLGTGEQWWPWMHIDDEIGIIKHAIKSVKITGPLNASSPNPLRQKDFIKSLAKIMKRPCFFPSTSMMIRTVLSEFSTEILSSRRMVPSLAVSSGYKFLYPEFEDAISQIIEMGRR